MDYDVIIVGAGPAGSTAARLCARKGLRTLIIEKDRFPRYKPCGGCLSPRVLRELDFDIGAVIQGTVYEARFTFQLEDPFSIVCPDPIGYLVMRESFDDHLRRKAQEAGADLYEERRVVGFCQDGQGVDVFIEGGESVRCRYLVGADGARSAVSQLLRTRAIKKTGMAFAGEARFPYEIQGSWSFVHLDFGGIPCGYGWIFPKGNLVSMGVGALFLSKGMRLKSRFERFIAKIDYIKGAEMERASFYPLSSFSPDDLALSRGRVALAGDAANLMDPMTGEGIYYAVRSGHIVGEAIAKAIEEDQKGIDGYQEALKSSLFQDLTKALKLARVIYRFPRAAYNILKSSRKLGLLYLDILAGNVRYEVFSGKMAQGIRRRLASKITEQKRLDNHRFTLL